MFIHRNRLPTKRRLQIDEDEDSHDGADKQPKLLNEAKRRAIGISTVISAQTVSATSVPQTEQVIVPEEDDERPTEKSTRNFSTTVATSRFDFQADVCKDYKETGYCGFGDSCKFLHDRSDYKSGWELEKEWDSKSVAEPSNADNSWRAFKDRQLNTKKVSKPTAECSACKREWQSCETAPCKTLCGHYFCEGCFLKTSSANCKICKKDTQGVFNAADHLLKRDVVESP